MVVVGWGGGVGGLNIRIVGTNSFLPRHQTKCLWGSVWGSGLEAGDPAPLGPLREEKRRIPGLAWVTPIPNPFLGKTLLGIPHPTPCINNIHAQEQSDL